MVNYQTVQVRLICVFSQAALDHTQLHNWPLEETLGLELQGKHFWHHVGITCIFLLSLFFFFSFVVFLFFSQVGEKKETGRGGGG